MGAKIEKNGRNNEDKELVQQKVPQTDKEIEDYLVRNERLLYDVVHNTVQGKIDPIDFEDYQQMAAIGFIKGIATFDAERPASLGTYCCVCAKNEILMSLRKSNAKCRKTNKMALGYADVYSVRNGDGTRTETEGPTPVYSDENDSLHPPIAAIEDKAETKMLTEKVFEAAGEVLSPEEYRVFCLYYQNERQVDIAKEIGKSQATVSKLTKSAIKKVRDACSDIDTRYDIVGL